MRKQKGTMERNNYKTEQTGMLFGPNREYTVAEYLSTVTDPKQGVHSGRRPDHSDWPKLIEIFDYVQTQWT